MEEVTLNIVYGELKKMHREIHELRAAIIPQEEITEAESKEFKTTISEMQHGKEKNWRNILTKRG